MKRCVASKTVQNIAAATQAAEELLATSNKSHLETAQGMCTVIIFMQRDSAWPTKQYETDAIFPGRAPSFQDCFCSSFAAV